jgi:hypothetical protein
MQLMSESLACVTLLQVASLKRQLKVDAEDAAPACRAGALTMYKSHSTHPCRAGEETKSAELVRLHSHHSMRTTSYAPCCGSMHTAP